MNIMSGFAKLEAFSGPNRPVTYGSLAGPSARQLCKHPVQLIRFTSHGYALQLPFNVGIENSILIHSEG